MLACRRRSSMNGWGKRPIRSSVLELHYRNPPATLIGRSGGDLGDERMLLEEAGEGAFQLSGAVAVNEAERALIAEQRLVEESLGARERFINSAANHIQIHR